MTIDAVQRPVTNGLSCAYLPNLMRHFAFLVCAFLAVTFGIAPAAKAADCKVAKQHAPSPAEQAFVARDYDKAITLYRTELATAKGVPGLTTGLVAALLQADKVQEALVVVDEALSQNHEGAQALAALLTAKAEVQYRQGLPADAAKTAAEAMHSDVCLARTHFILGRIAELNSYHAAARSSIQLAHTLDPWSDDIRAEWLETLPRNARITELEGYLAELDGASDAIRKPAQLYLQELLKSEAQPPRTCQLVSTAQSANLPLNALMYDASNIRAFGLDVRLNDKKTRLEIDTGAGGLTVSSRFAEQAKLTRLAAEGITGIGDQGDPDAYSAHADSIKIGDFEFRDCVVHVVSNKRMEGDGLVGLDVFSNFLITLNYPDRKLTLGPLPPRPGGGTARPTLGTGNFDNTDAAPGQLPGGPPSGPDSAGVSQDRYIAPQMKDYTQVYRIGHQLLLPVSLNNLKSCLMILDTGAWATTISPTIASAVTKVHLDRDSEVRGLNGKLDKVYSAGQITFTFAKKSQTIQDVPSFDTSRLSHLLGIETSGFLGARTLMLLTLHIDYRDGLIKLDYDPNKTGSSAYRPPE